MLFGIVTKLAQKLRSLFFYFGLSPCNWPLVFCMVLQRSWSQLGCNTWLCSLE